MKNEMKLIRELNEMAGEGQIGPRHWRYDDVDCYGEMAPEQNTLVKTDEDEYVLPRGFYNWKEAVRYVKRRDPDVVEMEAV